MDIYIKHQKAKTVTMSYMCKKLPLPLYVRLSTKIHSVQQLSNVSKTTETLEEKEFINLFRSKELLMFDDNVSSSIW